MANKKPTELDGILGSQLRDTQGEMLSIEGADISELEAGRGRWNDNHGKSFSSILGRITFAKKIFKAEDCTDDRQRYYWDKIKTPYIYGKGYLFDDEDHQNAKACAAILRNIHKTDCPLKLKMSVEGGVISRGIADTTLLARTKIHSCAITFTPANTATLVEPLNLDKSAYDDAADMELIKSVMHMAQTNVPSFRHIVRDAAASKILSNIEKIVDLMKGDNTIDLPTKQEILKYALESKVQSNVIKIHSLIEEVAQQDLEKNMKAAAIGALMSAAAIAPSPDAVTHDSIAEKPKQQHITLSKMPEEHQAAYKEVAKRNPMLGAIGAIESSGGINYKHDPITNKNSAHYGHTAGGMFGMMPNSANYILRNDPELAQKYPHLVEAAKDLKTNHKVFTDTFNQHPKVAAEFAEALLNRNKSKTNSNEMLFHSWYHGLKGTWNKHKVNPNSIKNADYVKKVMHQYNKIKPKSEKVKKALMAGYGGAAAPTSRFGGSVVQSEAIKDDGRSFKYITCPECGHEQIYNKFQVKCRNNECKKTFSLATLEKLFNR